jgi:excisionase family DNA binding protein
MSEEKEYLTIGEASQLCHVSRRTITSWLQKGHLTRFTTPNGYNVRIQAAELLAFDAERRKHPSIPEQEVKRPKDRYLG